MKMSTAQQSTWASLQDDVSTVVNKCQMKSNVTCPADTCDFLVSSCKPKQASLDAIMSTDLMLSELLGHVYRCPAYSTSGSAVCNANPYCDWKANTRTCGVATRTSYKIMRTPIEECNIYDDQIRVTARTAAKHIADHDLCPHAAASVKCRLITTEPECTEQLTDNSCKWQEPRANDPEGAMFPCIRSVEANENMQALYTSDTLAAIDLALLCTHSTSATCNADASCEWTYADDSCFATDEKISETYDKHPHMAMFGKALAICNLEEANCKTSAACVWAPSVGIAPGECLMTAAHMVSHAACECKLLPETFPTLSYDTSVCASPSPVSSAVIPPASASVITGIIIVAVLALG